MRAMEITMTDREFEVVWAALEMANTPYTDDDIPELVAREAKAWTVLQKVRHRAGLPDEPRPSEADPSS
jgi:hypothetical protein